MQEAGADGRVIIQLDGAGEPLEIFEAYESGGNVYLSVERKR